MNGSCVIPYDELASDGSKETAASLWRLLTEFSRALVRDDPIADRYVLELRRTNALGLSSRVGTLQQRLTHLLPDARVRDRLLAQARSNHPGKDDVWIYELVIDQLLLDRRA